MDIEIESFFKTTIERLRNASYTDHTFSLKSAEVLKHLLNEPENANCVIALPPDGLKGGFLRVLKKNSGIRIVINDKPENILQRIRFYDIDSQPIEKNLTDEDKKYLLREIKKDITFYRSSYQRANLHVDISGLNADQAALKIRETLETIDIKEIEQGNFD